MMNWHFRWPGSSKIQSVHYTDSVTNWRLLDILGIEFYKTKNYTHIIVLIMRFLVFFLVTLAFAIQVDKLQSFLDIINDANFKEENLSWVL